MTSTDHEGQRNRALADWRKARAIELATEGHTYDAIAKEIGIANRGTVHRMVKKALDARLVEDVDFYRTVELDRLNALQAAIWHKAEAGDVLAVNQVRRIIQDRVRLLGLDNRSNKERVAPSGPRTLIASPEEWAKYR